jgi:PAS domain S-box-containing protein
MPGHEIDLSEVLISFVDITKRKVAEEALRKSEQKLKYHFENSPLAVVEWDTNYYIINWSKEAERIFGWKSEEVAGKRIDTLNLIYEEDIPIVNDAMERLSGGKENTVVSTNRNYTKSGNIIESIWYNSVLLDNNGQMASTMSLVADITERKKAEEALHRSEENLRIFLDATQESLYMFDINGAILAANSTTLTKLQRSSSEVIGHNFSEFIPEDVAKSRMAYLSEVVKTGRQVQFEDIRNDTAFEHNFFPVFQDEKVIGVVSFSRDITVRNKMEEALKMREEQLKELNATKDKFFNIVAHDLKNPFTSLLGSTELLYENIHLLDSEKIRKLAQIMNDSAKSGYAILMNLLDWSRSQTGLIKLNPEKINLKTLIDKNISNLELYSVNKQIKIYSLAKEDFFVFADMNMINTVLRNLLSNGVKFTRKNGKVTVAAATTENEVTISVKDTGIGISDENIKKLFRIDTKFQLPGTDNEQGTGLGLKLCKEFVEKLGGKIWVESVENKGSNFKFSIPVKK